MVAITVALGSRDVGLISKSLGLARGLRDEAARAYNEALKLTTSESERRYLERRLAEVRLDP